jgi:molybdopterin-containing oxidoreductase family iron-sulfur binding subunit
MLSIEVGIPSKQVTGMDRRTFLKLTSLGSISFVAGCSGEPESHLYSMVKATEDMVTGKATWYASTCRECPAGCGVLAKNRDGRVIKLEGNPLHPVNKGALCMRGQAALQGIYNPDRLWTPQLKTEEGWRTIAFDEAEALIRRKVEAAAKQGPGRIAMFTETVGETQLNLFTRVMEQFGGAPPMVFEPIAYEALKFAHRQLFRSASLPVLHMDQADLIVGFGADFLETWLSPVEYARKFKTMHRFENGHKGAFVQVSPFMSLTGANADRWIGCRPGAQVVVMMGLIRSLSHARSNHRSMGELPDTLVEMANAYTPEVVTRLSGVAQEDQATLARLLLAAKRPLILGAGLSSGGRGQAAAAEMAALYLNLAVDSEISLFDFGNHHRVEIADSGHTVSTALEGLDDKDVSLVLLNNVNPVFALPNGSRVAEKLQSEARFTVAFSNFVDETSSTADLIVPVQMALESWDTYESNGTVISTMQPSMGKISQAPALGDLLLRLLQPGTRPADDYKSLVTRTVLDGQSGSATTNWLRTIQKGGHFSNNQAGGRPAINPQAAVTLKRILETQPKPDDGAMLMVVPSIRFFDGRGANKPWLQETPDTLSQVSWQNVALVHPDTLAAAGIDTGGTALLKSDTGEIEVPVYAFEGVFPGTIVVPLGQGHSTYGRWASNQGASPLAILEPAVDDHTGGFSLVAAPLSLKKGAHSGVLASTSGNRVALGRKIAPTVAMDEVGHEVGHHKAGLTMNDFPLTPPTPDGYDPKRDLYPPHDHDGYRWAMVVDMDRCIGCSACVVACYAENNIGIVGEERIREGREMAWLQIQRYHDPADMVRLTFLPMMCQHCDNAPCEAVCPVYAPHHSKEGLNNQIYNRCIGTRFCAQNCPYKVRRFNWFEWQWPEPLDKQLNPNVTVRTKGVMEKCSFCVQRIKVAHNGAKNQKRAIRDGEVIPACAQTCPTNALTFGSLMDKESRVSQLISDPRAYQVMGYLNTKPAVIYLKKVVQTI